jgi:hypothetical protein
MIAPSWFWMKNLTGRKHAHDGDETEQRPPPPLGKALVGDQFVKRRAQQPDDGNYFEHDGDKPECEGNQTQAS